ncbi:hypothetical protein VTN02DRAFT_3305 [Thermoascus thermophilus]
MSCYLFVPSRTEPGAMSQYDIDLADMPCFSGCPGWARGHIPESCVFCLESLDAKTAYRQLPCDHCFHQPCIDDWIRRHDASCPLCRQTFYHLRRPRLVCIPRVPPPPPPPPPLPLWAANRRPRSGRAGEQNHSAPGSTLNGFKAWCKRKLHQRLNQPAAVSTAQRSGQRISLPGPGEVT